MTNGGWSNYNGLLLNLTTRNYHGLTTTVSYTFSKAMNNATDGFRSTGGAGSSIALTEPIESEPGGARAERQRLPQRCGPLLRLQVP